MTGDGHGSGDRRGDRTWGGRAGADGGRDRARGIELEAATTTLSDGTTRWTVSPRDETGIALLSAWLTVDAAAVVDLERMR